MAVRLLTPSDAPAFRALRLEGLRSNPQSFGAHIDDEEALTVEEFARRITPTASAWVLGAFDDRNALRGVMGWYRERGAKRTHRSMLWGAFVEQSVRRSGYGTALLAELLSRVDEVPDLRHLDLHVWSGNTAAKSLYAKFGFRPVAVHPESLRVGERFIDEELWRLALPRNVGSRGTA